MQHELVPGQAAATKLLLAITLGWVSDMYVIIATQQDIVATLTGKHYMKIMLQKLHPLQDSPFSGTDAQ